MNELRQFLQSLGVTKIFTILATAGLSLAFMTYLILQSTKPDMALLFSQLDPADGAKIMDRLESMGIAAEARADGTQVYVPGDRVARIRMDLANAGLPSSGSIGYEIFDKADVLGVSSAVMDINHTRALEGELAKSIRSLQGVSGARVHLVIPKKELFTKDRALPSASIVLKMNRGRLNAEQVAGIQNLVAAAVSGLTAERISIVDDKGNLLARQSEGGVFDLGNNNDLKRGHEQRLSNSLENLLDKTLGMGKSRVEVNAEMDFDKITINSEEFNPEGQVIHSTNTANEEGTSSEAGSEGSVTVSNALPSAEAGGASGNTKSNNKNNRTEENITYDNSKIFKTHVKQSGTVKRLSVAVLVDGTYKDGKYAERPKEELDKLTTLVKTAMGFNADRGDIVEVVNMPFAPIDVNGPAPTLVENLMGTVNVGHLLDVMIPGMIGLLVFLLFFKPFVTRILNQVKQSAPLALEGQVMPKEAGGAMAAGGTPAAIASGAGTAGALTHEPSEGIQPPVNEEVLTVIDQDPQQTVSIIRNWMTAPQEGS